jgi:transcriptional regulator GlxA family with amidase domain
MGPAIPETLKHGDRARQAWTTRAKVGIICDMASTNAFSVVPRALDLRVARALRAMQQEPARSFRVAELAKLAGASRATFARLFIAATGRTPIRFLTERRLELAAQLLVTTRAPLSHIAELTGYKTEFALSRAFKRHHGLAPAHYRRNVATVRCAA